MKDDGSSTCGKSMRSTPIRAFGRALNWVGSTAKTVVKSPIRAAQRRRVQQAAVGETPLILEDDFSAGGFALHTLTTDYRGVVHQTQQKLSTQLQDSAEFLRQHFPFPSAQSTSGFLAANCFPPRLVLKQSQKTLTGEDAQDLVSVGSREMLRIKLYDFAIYLDCRQARQSQLSKQLGSRDRQVIAEGGSELAVTRGMRDSGDLDMCLMVRAARNLPIRLLAKEYERILRRRLRVVGGSPDDPALRTMLQCFREEVLPKEIRQGGSVRKGTVITFTRDAEGNLDARTNSHDLVRVKSPKLAQAVFDIYLGDQVVSTHARREAGHSFLRMIGGTDFEPLRDQLVCTDKACRVGRLY